MATIPIQPLMLKDAVLTVASDDFTAAFTSVTFEPSPEWEWVDVFLGPSVPMLSRVRWVCRLGYLQDLTTFDSWTRYIDDNTGTTATLTFTPESGGDGVVADVLLIPGNVGGGATEQLSAEVSLPVVGAPTLVGESY